jgi:cytochrome c-type biogenesis protein CcmH
MKRAGLSRISAAWVLSACALVAVAAIALVVASGARPPPAEVARDVSSNVMSPFCPGLTLHDCPSDAAVALRGRIEGWARAGMSEDRIMERLQSEYGSEIRAAPEGRGAGMLAWLLPGVALLAGSAVAWTAARRWARNRASDSTETAERLSESERMRLDAELAALRAPGLSEGPGR